MNSKPPILQRWFVTGAGLIKIYRLSLPVLDTIELAAVSFYKANSKVMDQLKMTEAPRKATLRDGQDAGEWLLDVEAKIGELLPSIEETTRLKGGDRRSEGKHRRVLPDGIHSRQAHQARTIKDNPEVVARIKAQARENEDIPTKTAVLNAVQYEKR
jgi:hypothetical protein